MMFLTSPGLKVIALNAGSGQEIWRFDPYDGGEASGVNRGVTYWSDGAESRILYVAGSYLYALNAQTGKVISSFGGEGRVDLYEGLGREVKALWITAATPGIIYKDLLILGSTLGEGAKCGGNRDISGHSMCGQGNRSGFFIPFPGREKKAMKTWPEDAWERIGGANAWGRIHPG